MMDQATKDQWVKDLRSGNFCQTDGLLGKRLKESKKYSYCCLGVLGLRCGMLKTVEFKNFHGVVTHYYKVLINDDAEKDFLSYRDKNNKELPLKYNGRTILPMSVQKKLAGMNDDGRSFKEIADWIEKNVKARPNAA